mgnify:FL=1|tara:strand:+ start:922 stop:1068 length:147 start_codon:yes stop_codon:yes gene_type:complete
MVRVKDLEETRCIDNDKGRFRDTLRHTEVEIEDERLDADRTDRPLRDI